MATGPATVTYGGVALDADIEWGLSAGVAPLLRSTRVSIAVASQLWALDDQPLPLEFISERIEGVDEKKDTVTYNGVSLIYWSAISDYTIGLVFADRRYLWASRLVHQRFNIKGQIDASDGVASGTERTGPADPNRLLDQHFRVPRFRYAPWSLLDGEPWTALQIADHILKTILEPSVGIGYGGAYDSVSGAVDIKALENNYTPESLELIGAPAAAALARMLYFARCNISTRQDGKIYLYRIDTIGARAVSDDAGQRTLGTSTIYERDWRRLRPAEVKVSFEREIEIAFSYDAETYDADKRDIWLGDRKAVLHPVLLLNAPEQFDMTDSPLVPRQFGGKKLDRVYPVNTAIALETAFAGWEAAGVGIGGYESGETNEDFLRRYWMLPGAVRSQYLSKLHGLGGTFLDALNGGDPVADARIGSLQQHWRRTFQIPWYFVERAIRIQANRVLIVDPVTHIRPPSPVYLDYNLIFYARAVEEVITGGQYNGFRNLTSFVPENATGVDESEEATAIWAFHVNVEASRGIVHLVWNRDLEGMISKFAPGWLAASATSDLPPQVIPAVGGGATLEKSAVLPRFKVIVVLTVTLGENKAGGGIDSFGNDETQMYTVTTSASDVGVKRKISSQLPAKQIFSRRDTARYPIDSIDRAGNVTASGPPDNVDFLGLIAKSETVRYYEAQMDYDFGSVEIEGARVFNPFGHTRAIITSYRAGVITTRLVMADRPPSDVYSILANSSEGGDLLRFLQRGVPAYE